MHGNVLIFKSLQGLAPLYSSELPQTLLYISQLMGNVP